MKTLLHIELTNLCTLKCPGCHRTQRIDAGEEWHNHSLALADLEHFIDIDMTDKQINFCGNYGDAIYHPDFLDIMRWFKSKGAVLEVTTNGNHRKCEFWEEFASIVDERDHIIFSVDGLPDDYTQYRINGEWGGLEVSIRTMARSRARTTWKYIVFNYNEKEIGIASNLSWYFGVDEFVTHNSNRYTDAFNLRYLPSSQYVSPEVEVRKDVLEGKSRKFSPKCKGRNPSFNPFIDAEGYFVPCCLLADRRFYYDTMFYKERERFNIKTTTLSAVLADLKLFYQFNDKIDACKFFCSK